jgi:hypothetical protein
MTAFLRIQAPDLTIVATERFGSTDPSTTVICEVHHLPQLLRLQGKTSPEHGISSPLNLHCDVQLMGLQTCTFCWAPGHGSTRCPHRTTASNPATITSHQPACRHCYSFSHHAAACRDTNPVTCRLCLTQGHASHDCPHFKPRKQALAAYLRPHTHPSQSHPQAPPILSAAQRASARPWQIDRNVNGTEASLSSPSSTSPVPSALRLHYVTPDQLQQALAPIAAALHELMTRFNPVSSSTMSTSARGNPVFSSPSPLYGQ